MYLSRKAFIFLVVSSASLAPIEFRDRNNRPSILQPIAHAQTVNTDRFDRLRSDEPSKPDLVIMAQADDLDEVDEEVHDKILDSHLSRDDIRAAKAFVDALAKNEELSAATISSMNNRIWRIKADLIVKYSGHLREAIARSDFEAVRDYSERMRHLTEASPPATPTLTDDVDVRGPVEIDSLTLSELDELAPTTQETRDPSAGDERKAIVEHMRRALEEDHLFPPAENNAFDLATARLAAAPDDTEVHDILSQVLARQQDRVQMRLEDGRPARAQALTIQLFDSLTNLDADAAWSSSYRTQASLWAEDVRPEINAALIAKAEMAIERRRLMIAPGGETSAQGYLELLVSELGKDHDHVMRLANDITTSYGALIDERLNKQQYESASTLHSRMETFAAGFGVALDQVAALGNEIEAMQSKQRQYDRLMLLANQWRDRGQLVEPVGANALESTAEAIKLAFNPAEANVFLDEVVNEQRGKIDLLIREDHLLEASSALMTLGSAIEPIGGRQTTRATEYYAEAARIKRQAEAKDNRRQLQQREAQQKPPPEIVEDQTEPLIFVNPF